MKNIFGLYLIVMFAFLIVGCTKKDEVVIPIKPNLPIVEKAREGNNTYESLLNILTELDQRRAIENNYK